MHPENHRPKRRRALLGTALVLAAAVALSGCSDTVYRGWLPGSSQHEVTDQTGRIVSLWRGSWIAALLVGLLVWGLILWCVSVYRKRKADDTLPVQLRYHVPLEVMYVVLPILMVGVLFYYTNRDVTAITAKPGDAKVHVQVIGKQWSWDVNYQDANVYDSGVQIKDLQAPGALDEPVTIWLPVDEKVLFTLNSRDVIHSFWVPAFLYKMDVIPGRTNQFEVTPTTVGEYRGKCAELCGEYHSRMLFNVKVVTRAEYDAHLADLKAKGQTGQLGLDLSRSQDLNSSNTVGSAG